MEERIKKSSLAAGNVYDYKKIMYPNPYFIEAKIEEDEEELVVTYQLEGQTSLQQIRAEDVLERLAILRNAAVLTMCREEFRFRMNPDNLYYDRNHLVYVKQRDIYEEGGAYSPEEWLKEYKSLIGYALQKQYSYKDYLNGGMQLLKNGFLGRIREAETADEVRKLLEDRYDEIAEERRRDKILLNKKHYIRLRRAFAVLLALCIAGGAYIAFDRVKNEPYQQAVIAAESAYIEGDYVGCIDEMESIKVGDMNTTQKYILANSYVRGENLTQEQKDNVGKKLSVKETSSRLEYWIYLGRNDMDQAIDIAMQQSDDEMLLYAYMKQKSKVEADNSLTGEEKNAKLEAIAQKMQPLMEKYETEEE